ncbi:MAG: hypothetical protein LBV37_03255, partial [Mycoplasmataceae bacterium]|nr:hypothetical protein [Mycoplasmataceae bacterium]
MSDILKNIVSEVKVNDEPTLLENLSISKSTNNTLNNLDDIDDNIGTFNVKIFGIGGAGCNVITHMLHSRHWPDSVKIYALNTDIKALRKIKNISNVYLLGKTKLRGAG